eukprot:TRINITY_DN6207_c0_g1_i1.p1 TRINITY_DN6207_c0_g1~~TRINITY_DN6207_c0_g1_i1.p1  ORF type:complete len:161 (+),score=15.64 TRINITY_DN6207_c0_g1_i1:126-608(+)
MPYFWCQENCQTTMEVGAVASLRFVKGAARAAKLVLQHTEHTLLVGDQASEFAISLGLPGPVDLRTDESIRQWWSWTNSSCQPNFWRNVRPDNKQSCGPYELDVEFAAREKICEGFKSQPVLKQIGYKNHDTIAMAAIDIVWNSTALSGVSMACTTVISG